MAKNLRKKMQDLFGNEIPEEKKKTHEGFDEFWSAYPKCFRKGEKASCKKKWADSYYFMQKEIIVKHRNGWRQQHNG